MSSSSSSVLVTAAAALLGATFAAAGLQRFYYRRKERKKAIRTLRRQESVTVTLPDWAITETYYERSYTSDEDMMALAIHLSARNVAEGTGGPFGCAIFRRDLDAGHAELVSVGMNLVVPLDNSTLHGETVAIQLAQGKVGSYTLDLRGKDDEGIRPRVQYELFTSCEPCAMCLGATLWSGVSRIVCGATKDDATSIGFDEGPVFEESYEHLRSAGIEVKRGVMQEEAAAVLQKYGEAGVIYNR